MAEKFLGTAFTTEQLKSFLDIHQGAVLVGGMALAFWVEYFRVSPHLHQAAITRDIDLFGTRKMARFHGEKLKAKFPKNFSFEEANIDSLTPNSAVIMLDGFNGHEEPIRIDYLQTLMGYSYDEEQKMRQRAISISIDGLVIRCMHPFDCLKSRVHNLIHLPNKRNGQGVEQTRLSIEVLKAMLVANCDSEDHIRKIALPIAEEIISLAHTDDAIQVWHYYQLGVLRSISPTRLGADFKKIRWPQATQWIQNKYDKRFKNKSVFKS